MAEPIEVVGEEVEPTTAALVHVQPIDGLTKPVASREDVLVAFRAYQAQREAILQPTDFQTAGGKTFVTKSGWRKLAVAMGVSGEMQTRDYERDEQGRITRAEVVVRAIAPNGRFMDGLGVCDYRERCKPACFNEKRSGGLCDGFNHFSKSQHDIPATAATRALNRACSDLFGFGEVSAEEVSGESAPPPEGFDTHELAHAAYDEIVQATRELAGYRTKDEGGPVEGTPAAAFAEWHRDNGFKMPYSITAAAVVREKLGSLSGNPPENPQHIGYADVSDAVVVPDADDSVSTSEASDEGEGSPIDGSDPATPAVELEAPEASPEPEPPLTPSLADTAVSATRVHDLRVRIGALQAKRTKGVNVFVPRVKNGMPLSDYTDIEAKVAALEGVEHP